MPRQSMAPAIMLKIAETQHVGSSLSKTTWEGVANVPNKADAISAVMDPKFVDEIRNGRNGGQWRFATAEGIEKFLDLGKPDDHGNLHYKIIREGEKAGIYFLTYKDWLETAPQDSLKLHEPSIREAIREGRPLAVAGYYDCWGWRLGVYGYYGDDATRVAQFETTSEASATKLLRGEKGKTAVLRTQSGHITKITVDESFEVTIE